MTTRALTLVRLKVRALLSVYPRLTGYRYVRTISLLEPGAGTEHYRVVFAGADANFPAPSNRSFDMLSTAVGVSGYSWKSAPNRRIDEVTVGALGHVDIVEHLDEWNNGFYGLLWRRRASLSVSGCGWLSQHAAMVSAQRTIETHIVRGAWFFEAWSGNYFHWMTRCLPKAILLAREFPDYPLLVPSGIVLSNFQLDSLKLLGLKDKLLYLKSPITRVDSLAVVGGMKVVNPRMLDLVRTRLARSSPNPIQRIFVSRQAAAWRRLVNEEEVMSDMRKTGFRAERFESLSLSNQILLMSSAERLVGTHGAGLTNMLFAPTGLRIIEIADPKFVNPDYYWLAQCLGHKYAVVDAEVSGEMRPGYHNLKVNVAHLLATVDAM